MCLSHVLISELCNPILITNHSNRFYPCAICVPINASILIELFHYDIVPLSTKDENSDFLYQFFKNTKSQTAKRLTYWCFNWSDFSLYLPLWKWMLCNPECQYLRVAHCGYAQPLISIIWIINQSALTRLARPQWITTSSKRNNSLGISLFF